MGNLQADFVDLFLHSNRISGNHVDVPTYRRESRDRSASDTQSHDGCKTTIIKEFEPANKKVENLVGGRTGVSPRSKKKGLEAHHHVVNACRDAARAHARYVIVSMPCSMNTIRLHPPIHTQ
jgi:hypothetical protein